MDNRKSQKIVIGVVLGFFIIFAALIGKTFAQTAEEYFQQGKAYLENQQLTEANTSFQNALISDPYHQGANLFYGLTRLMMISNSTDFNNLLNRAGVSSSGRDIFNWTADFTRDPEGRIILPSDSPTGQELQNFLKNNILPEINGGLNDNLPKVTNSFQTTFKFPIENGTGSVSSPNTLIDTTQYWGFNEWVGYKIVVDGTQYTITGNTNNSITVSPNWIISPGTYGYKILEEVEIDYGDVLVIKGSLNMAKAGIYILSAYNLNVDIDTIVSLYNNLSLNFQNNVINTYTQLLTLLPSQQLPQAKVILRDAINTFIDAINFIVAESDPQTDDLFIIDDPLKEQEYRYLLADLNNSLDGTTYIRDRKIEQYVNLSQFFDSPKVLRNYLPIFRGQYFIQGGSYPDPTFGGIMPYMTANQLDQGLRKTGLWVAPPPPLRLYDDFSGSYIDKNKWLYGEWVSEIDTLSQKLTIKQASPNPVVATTFPYTESNWLNFFDPESLNTIQADIAIVNYNLTNQGYTRARIGGKWYNDGTPGDGMTGDIWASVELRASPDGFTAKCGVSKFTNANGTTWVDLAWRTFTTVPTLGTPYTLYISYDGANNFTFKIGDETITLGPSDAIPPRTAGTKMPFKGIGTRVQIDNSASSGYISASFDNVYKNGSPYDDFSSTTIDPTKWTNYEFVREISEGKLRSVSRSEGNSIWNNLSFPNPAGIRAVKAKITPITFNNPDGAYTTSRLGGYFYRDLWGWWWYYPSPPGGYWGDVWAEVGIGGSGTTPTAYWAVIRFTNVEGTTWEVLGSGTFPITINLGATYELYVYWDGFTFTFKCNDYEAIYAIDKSHGSIYFGPANNKFKGLQTRIRQTGTNQKAFVESTFDDVMVYTRSRIVDFDGDGATDVAAFHLASDQFFTDYAGNLGQYGWGGSDCYPLIWDYDGDGKTEVSIYHIPTNQWFVKGVPGDNLGAFGWGQDQSVPVPGDYNGDGVIERAFYHWPTNRWFVEGAGGSFTAYDFGWGGSDCIPIAADYDGDGKTDMMLYHLPSNQWFVYGIGNLGQFGWNGSECIPVPGDWDGDGEIDLAVYHVPSNEWVWRDKIGTPHFLGQYGWGGIASFPIPGDYDGDGVMERAFYRPSENRWFIEGEPDFIWGWDTSNFMPITSQMAIYNWFRFVLGMFQ